MSDNKPYLPARDLKVERAVGRFIFAWGALEREIDEAIHDLLFTNLRTGMIVTANLAMRAKLDLVHALFETLRSDDDSVWRPISGDWEDRFDKLVNMTAKANAESRISIVHSQPMAIKLDKGDQPIWLRMAARKGGLRGSGVSYTKSYLDRQTQTVVDLIHEWATARVHWKSAVQAIRSADADEWLGRTPDDQDHLTLQLQSSHGSPKATPKPKQQKKPKRRA
ncbi:hypothetical protein NKI39_30520 [Mesorhizobium sp. M0664]|uniref:hypothetical protein n=1 Tax=Mesorhizobium sp. M0664 TaxID=2956982 RepID=UPI003337879F